MRVSQAPDCERIRIFCRSDAGRAAVSSERGEAAPGRAGTESVGTEVSGAGIVGTGASGVLSSSAATASRAMYSASFSVESDIITRLAGISASGIASEG